MLYVLAAGFAVVSPLHVQEDEPIRIRFSVLA